jgi:YesN/AraC family two-component response regulator
MPDLNGLQLYQSLKTMNPSCKIIFMSALSVGPELVSILPGITSENIVRKPIDKKAFTKKIIEVYNQI